MINEYIKDNKLRIIVKANSPDNKIIGYDENRDALRVEISEPADKNKANVEIVKFFSKLTGKKVRILTGVTSKRKILEFSPHT